MLRYNLNRRYTIKKTFVIDTNVILHDADAISSFQDNDVVIPITVIEEIDRFKKGSDNINVQARRFIRFLDKIKGDILDDMGAPLGNNLGTVRVVFHKNYHPNIQNVFLENSADHRILNTALILSQNTNNVVLVSKDVNLRLKARSLGLIASDYYNDKVKSLDVVYKGARVIKNSDPQIIDTLFSIGSIPQDYVTSVDIPIHNEFFIFKSGSKSVLATFNNQAFHKVERHKAFSLKPRNAEQAFALNALLNNQIPLVTITGKAGTGKTILTLAAALQLRRNYRQILLARPIVALSNKDIGFLPGDIDEKLEPYMQPLFDNLNVLKHMGADEDKQSQKISEMQEQGKINVTPLAYIRGRSLPHVYFIIDEAQNLSPHEVKTIITRAGEGTKIVFTGDIQQIDQPYLDQESNGLSYLISKMKGQTIFAHINLERGERSKLADIASDLL